MRLNRLDLIRYGRFQDTALDFGPPPDGGPDVTVVYGANEAGKSTAFTAWLDFLFGFQGGAHYAFRFDRKDLLIGAVLETPDGIQTLRRTAASAGSLTDANGHVVADQRMAGWLFGLDREAYRTRFSLNDTILREGGKEIAQAQGDLGQLLHAGSSGLAGLSNALAKIEDEVAAFHKKGGRKTLANEGRNRLRELDAELRVARLDPRTFDRLVKARDDSEAAFQTASDALAAARRALKLREAADVRRDLAQEIDGLRGRLADYPAGPVLPPEAVSRVASAAQRRANFDAKAAKARTAAQAATEKLATFDGDPEGQKIAAHLEEIETAVFGDGELLLPRVQTAHADVSKRREERRDIAARMQDLAARLAGPGTDPASVLLPKALIEDIRRAADAVRTARAALDGETKARWSAEIGLGEPIEVPDGLDRLEDAVSAWHPLPGLFEEALRVARAAEDALAEQTAGLPPDWRAAAEAGLPELAEIDAVTELLQAARSRRDSLADLTADAEREWELSRSARDAVGARPDLVLDHQVAETRGKRDAAWIAHRAALNPATADGFERAMRDDDVARDRHALTAEGRVKFAQTSEEAARRRTLLDRRGDALAKEEAEVATAEEAIASMAIRLGLPEAPAKALRQRRDRLAIALHAARQAEASRAAAEALRSEKTACLKELRDALEERGEQVLDDRVPAVANRTLREMKERKAAADAWREGRKAIDGMKRSEALAAQALSGLEAALTARLDGLWCGGLDADRVLDALPALEELAALDAEHVQLDRRIRAMEDAIETFEPMAVELRALLGLPAGASPTEVRAGARRRSAEAAEAMRVLETQKVSLAEAERDFREAADEREIPDREIARILEGQGGGEGADPIQVVNVLSQRDALRQKLHQAVSAYEAAGRTFDPEALVAEEAKADPIRTDTIRDHVQNAEQLRDEALAKRTREQHALDTALAGEGGLAPDQERAALIEQLRQASREAAARQFGLLAAWRALRRFRQSHRGAMLEATEKAFSHITGGEWPRLDTQTQGATERLVGMRNDAPVAVSAMSTGTQGQLYLALRIAGHAAFVAERGPLPFVTDDIHETFDNDRARAALELAAVMGGRGQAILFTHHRHLVDLARSAIPSVRVLELV